MLSQKTRYALRALLHLAEAPSGRPVAAAEIAEGQRVPRKFLEIILLDLKKAGFVVSRRGPGGGYVLARPAAAISFADVIRVTDGMIALVPCASLNFYAPCGDCHDEATCAIRLAAMAVREASLETLSRTTLASAASFELGEADLSPRKESVA